MLMKYVVSSAFILVFGAGAATAPIEDPVTTEAAFQSLKYLAGRWEGTAITPDGPKAAVEYRLTAGGNVVMEILFPGDSHEMISMYYLDRGKLVAKHYCSMGNQPEMALNEEGSSSSELRFDFTGGTNLDPDKDAHIHGGRIGLKGPDRLENEWNFYEGGKKMDSNRFYLTRSKNK